MALRTKEGFKFVFMLFPYCYPLAVPQHDLSIIKKALLILLTLVNLVELRVCLRLILIHLLFGLINIISDDGQDDSELNYTMKCILSLNVVAHYFLEYLFLKPVYGLYSQ
ncbi:hypothetical protein MXB_5631 [Myxobolus squamalis]|nr:hypothetical protein MXB_5631 [Myxobolus squamalis]